MLPIKNSKNLCHLHNTPLHEAQTIIYHMLMKPSTNTPPPLSPGSTPFSQFPPVFPVFPHFSSSTHTHTSGPHPNAPEKGFLCFSGRVVPIFPPKTNKLSNVSISPLFPSLASLPNSVPAKFQQQEKSGTWAYAMEH